MLLTHSKIKRPKKTRSQEVFSNLNKQPVAQKKNVIYYNCNKAGHYTSACLEKKKQKSKTVNATLFAMQLLKHTTIDVIIEMVLSCV